MQALNLGANDLLEKPFAALQLEHVVLVMRALRTRGGYRSIDQIVSPQIVTLAVGERARQLIVDELKGLGNGDIAAQLAISQQAVKSALHALYRKLAIAIRGELLHLISAL